MSMQTETNFGSQRGRRIAYRMSFGGAALAIFSFVPHFVGAHTLGAFIFWIGFALIAAAWILGSANIVMGAFIWMKKRKRSKGL